MSEHWYANPTQIYFTCRALVTGQTLNHMDVIRGVKSWRLAAIVCTLRNEYGWPIDKEERGPEHIAHYFLSKSCDPAALTYPPSARHLLRELEDLGLLPHKDGIAHG